MLNIEMLNPGTENPWIQIFTLNVVSYINYIAFFPDYGIRVFQIIEVLILLEPTYLALSLPKSPVSYA